jgi:hypothetical protein
MDFRFNGRLADECDDDIYQQCRHACDVYSGRPCGGTVLRCLQEQEASIASSECRFEVKRFAKLKVCYLLPRWCEMSDMKR